MKFHLSNLFNGRKALAEQEEASGEMNILKAGLLEKPESAIAQARLAAKLMFDETKDASILAAGLLKDYEENAYMQIKKSEEKVDLYEDQICNYLLEISKRKLTTAESQRVSVLLHTVNDLETSVTVPAVSVWRTGICMREMRNFRRKPRSSLNWRSRQCGKCLKRPGRCLTISGRFRKSMRIIRSSVSC